MSDDTKVICPQCVHEFSAIPVAVQEELAALRAEAERYRWLRDYALQIDFTNGCVDIWISGLGEDAKHAEGENIDAAIDAARGVKG